MYRVTRWIDQHVMSHGSVIIVRLVAASILKGCKDTRTRGNLCVGRETQEAYM